MLHFIGCFLLFIYTPPHKLQYPVLQQDSTAIFIFEKKPSFIKNTKSYFFKIDSKGICYYKGLKQLLKPDSFYTTSLNDSTVKYLFEKINQIQWKDALALKIPELDAPQKINIQYSNGKLHWNIIVNARPLTYNIKPVEVIIENIIASAKWKKQSISLSKKNK
jgi:hypothetical protein